VTVPFSWLFFFPPYCNFFISPPVDTDINFMYTTALDKIAFLPFGLIMDLYRYDIFDGKINSSSYNSKWWDYR